MKNLRTKTIAAALMALAAFVIAGCSDKDSGQITETLLDHNTDSFSNYASAYSGTEDDFISGNCALLNDMILKDNNIFAVADEGALIHDLDNGANQFFSSQEPLTAIIDLGDRILVGGEKLYILDSAGLSAESCQPGLPAPITIFYPYGDDLLIGTTDGLYLYDFETARQLAEGMSVTAIASDTAGVWIGTAGQGLYRWDGVSFAKRYLKRDSTLFDNVTALDYNHNHLYLGTDEGLYIYDGGQWQPYGVADGLPSERITAVSATDWVIRIGTADGPVAFHNNEFTGISRMEGMIVTKFLRSGQRLLAATTSSGLIMKSGGLVTTLFDGDIKTTQVALEE